MMFTLEKMFLDFKNAHVFKKILNYFFNQNFKNIPEFKICSRI